MPSCLLACLLNLTQKHLWLYFWSRSILLLCQCCVCWTVTSDAMIYMIYFSSYLSGNYLKNFTFSSARFLTDVQRYLSTERVLLNCRSARYKYVQWKTNLDRNYCYSSFPLEAIIRLYPRRWKQIIIYLLLEGGWSDPVSDWQHRTCSGACTLIQVQLFCLVALHCRVSEFQKKTIRICRWNKQLLIALVQDNIFL